MLTVSNLSKAFEPKQLLHKVSFTVNPGERLALIGANGCGKSTLVKIIAGELQPDAGKVTFSPSDLRVGYLPQQLIFPEGESLGGYLDRCQGGLAGLSSRLAALAEGISQKPDDPDLQAKYENILAEIEEAAGNIAKPQTIAGRLGLGDYSPETPVAILSGGQKTRLALAGVLLSNPQLLILDEPTNHLDLEMLAWLEEWLLEFPGGTLYISHDRSFLDKTAMGILELSSQTRNTSYSPGNYTAYLEGKLAAREKHWQAYRDQQDEINRLRGAIQRRKGEASYKEGGKADSDKFAKGFYKNRSAGTIRRAKQLEKRIEYLLDEGRLDKPRANWQMKIDFETVEKSSRNVLVMNDLSVGYGNQPLIERISHDIHFQERIALVGANGSGKTTLLKTICAEIPPLDGRFRLSPQIQVGYMDQEQSELDPDLNPLQTIQREAAQSETAARTFLSYFLFTGDHVFTPVMHLSHGERARLTLACLVASGCNFLLLDEPINHLDIPSRTRFEAALQSFQGTILAVVHDRYFIDGFSTAVWELKDRTIRIKSG